MMRLLAGLTGLMVVLPVCVFIAAGIISAAPVTAVGAIVFTAVVVGIVARDILSA